MGLKPTWRAVPYDAALKAPLGTARGAIASRQGWYVAVEAFGTTGLGEVTAEPAWGTERPEEVQAGLVAIGAWSGRPLASQAPRPPCGPPLPGGEGSAEADGPSPPLIQLPVRPGLAAHAAPLSGTERVRVSGGEVPEAQAALTAWLAASPVSAKTHPALHAALELALLDALARASGQPLAGLLAAGAAPRASVPTAALVGALPPEEAARQAARAVAAGHRTVKLKLDGTDDVARATAVRAAIGPEVALRLDANALWPDVDDAAGAMAAFIPLAPEFFEQPVSGLEALATLQPRVPFPLAADEALVDAAACERALALGVPVLVLKPMWRGGLLAARAVAARAQVSGARLVLSSSLDRGVGTAGVLHLAAALAEPGCVGLGTLGLYADGGALAGLGPVAGSLAVPTVPGLGGQLRDPLLRQLAEVAA
ncbi:MAG: enolase C-terminal domain-like protein [Candidatus Sericytochromatia bacterium]|nr:enolase C-terminal domain-like protein [Candidatus Sericytochromatia bacterium]